MIGPAFAPGSAPWSAPGAAPGSAFVTAAERELSPAERRRGIPDDARHGEMSPPRGRLVAIDGKRRSLAPGVTIRDRHNRLILPANVQREVDVWYTVDQYGQIKRVWIAEGD